MLTRAEVQELEREVESLNGVTGVYTPQRKGFVYFVREENGPIKIGWGQNPQRRMAGMQTGNPRRLVLLGCMPATRKEERQLHARFADLRLAGEWFQPHEDILAFVETLQIPGAA